MSVSSDRRQGVNAGAAIKVPCSAVATTPITLAGEQTINGIAVHAANTILRTNADRVLVTAQANSAANGVYDVSTAAWRRTQDFNGEFDLKPGTAVPVWATGDYSIWILNAVEPIIVDTSPLEFVKQTNIPPLDSLATILPWLEMEDDPAPAAAAVALTSPWQGQQTFWVTTTAESSTITGNLNVSATFGSATKPTVADTNWLTRQPRVVFSSPGVGGLAGVQGGGGVFPIQLSSGPGGSFTAELMHGTGPVWAADAGYFAGISSSAPLNANLDGDPINYIGMYLQGGGSPSGWRTIAKTAAGAAVTTDLGFARGNSQIFIQRITFVAGSGKVHQTITSIDNTTGVGTVLFDADMASGLPAAGVGLEVNIALRENVIACDMHFMRATIVIPQP